MGAREGGDGERGHVDPQSTLLRFPNPLALSLDSSHGLYGLLLLPSSLASSLPREGKRTRVGGEVKLDGAK